MIYFFSQKLSCAQVVMWIKYLDQFSISFSIMSDYRFSNLAICYQKSVLLQCHKKGEGISVIKLCKPRYSNNCVSISILYMRQLLTIPAFFSNLELLNNASEINIVLQDFNLDVCLTLWIIWSNMIKMRLIYV